MSTDKYPIGGYAPGNYHHHCSACGQFFQGDKGAIQCEPCAIKDKEFYDALAPNQKERFDKLVGDIVKQFFEIQALQQENKRLREALQNLVDLKAYKDKYGKDEGYYERQPVAWHLATESLKQKS